MAKAATIIFFKMQDDLLKMLFFFILIRNCWIAKRIEWRRVNNIFTEPAMYINNHWILNNELIIFWQDIYFKQVGQTLRRLTAGSGKKLSLEFGSKSPVVVIETADLHSTVEGVVDAIWFNQGQVRQHYHFSVIGSCCRI